MDDLINKFKEEIGRSLLIESAEKAYWTAIADTLPGTLLERIYENVKTKNGVVDRYVDEALSADPDIIFELKNKIGKLKKQIARFKEAEEGGSKKAEEILLEEIQKL